MNPFTLELADRNTFNRILMPQALTYTPRRWGFSTRGGPDFAEIEVTGEFPSLWDVLKWLRHEARIVNDEGTTVWWGYINEVVVDTGRMTFGLTLEEMYNHVTVRYSYVDTDGASNDASTTTAVNYDSYNYFGRKEIEFSGPETTEDGANALRDRIINWHAKALPTIEPSGGEQRATIRCNGWYDTLSWRYYSDLTGKITHEDSNGDQAIGWKLTNNEIAFTRDNRIHQKGRALLALTEGDTVVITGSNSNNKTVVLESGVGSVDDDEPLVKSVASVYLDALDDIMNDAGNLNFFDSGDVFKMTGTPNGGQMDGWYMINDASDATHITVHGDFGDGPIGGASSATVTFYKTLAVRAAEDSGLAHEAPGNNVTLTKAGTKVAQLFKNTTGTWTANEIMIRIRKDGGPTDNTKIEVCADNSGAPGTVLANATLAASSIGTKMAWHKFAFGSPATLSPNTNYWLVVSRTTAPTDGSFYEVSVDEDLGYTDGYFKLWDGSNWINRDPDADLVFQVWGTLDNVTQVSNIVTACGQFIAGQDFRTTSGVNSRHYREGGTTALDEITALLDQGTSTGKRLFVTVLPNRVLRLTDEPASSMSSDMIVDRDGVLYNALGVRIAAGRCPVGVWARVRELPPSSNLERVSPFFVERCDYDPASGRWMIEPRGVDTMRTMPTLWQKG